MNDLFCYSANCETYSGDFKSREEALEEGIKEVKDGRGVIKKGDKWQVYTAKIVPAKGVDFYNGLDWLIEEMADSAIEEHGDAAEYWLDKLSSKAQHELEEEFKVILDKWFKKYDLEPKFWDIDDIIAHLIEGD